MMKRKTKPFDQMNTKELAAATAEFDKEFIIDTFRPMTPAERAQWERACRNPGRLQRGKGIRVISVRVEKDLLDRADRVARRLGVARDELISRSLRAVLIIVGME